MPCESSKIKRKAPDGSKIADFTLKFILRVRVKSAILRFKAQDEVLSLALKQHGHKHFVGNSFLLLYNTILRTMSLFAELG